MPASVRSALVPELTADYQIKRYRVTGQISENDRAAAIELLSESLAPCPKELAMKAMYTLKVRTANTPAEREIAEERIAIYMADLLHYPADVVISACKAIASQSRWFPAWADLYKELEWRVNKRKKALKALNAD